MAKTLNDLIAELEELRDQEDCGDSEVRFAAQPSYPMAYTIAAPTPVEQNGETVIYLPEGSQIGRAPRSAFDGGF